MTGNKILPGCGIHHIALRALDLERAIHFYTQALGFHVIARWLEGPETIAMLDTGNGTVLEIFHGGASGEQNWDKTAGAMFHLAFAVDDVDTGTQSTQCLCLRPGWRGTGILPAAGIRSEYKLLKLEKREFL